MLSVRNKYLSGTVALYIYQQGSLCAIHVWSLLLSERNFCLTWPVMPVITCSPDRSRSVSAQTQPILDDYRARCVTSHHPKRYVHGHNTHTERTDMLSGCVHVPHCSLCPSLFLLLPGAATLLVRLGRRRRRRRHRRRQVRGDRVDRVCPKLWVRQNLLQPVRLLRPAIRGSCITCRRFLCSRQCP